MFRSPRALALLLALASSALVAEVWAQGNDTDGDYSDAVDGAPVVEFVGGAPKVKIYPAGSAVGGSTWIMLTFGKIQELTSSGAKVTQHSIMSLASQSGVIWSQESRSVGGTTALVTRMELPLEYTSSFKVCPGRRMRRLSAVGYIAIEVFLFAEAATIVYGTETIEVAKGSMKFNIESETWPFCASTNKLEVNIDIKIPSGGSGGSMGNAGGNGPPGHSFTANAGGSDVTMELPTVTLLDGSLTDCDVALDTTGGKMNLAFTFPAFTNKMVYDPAVAFSSDTTTGDGSTTSSDGSSTSSGNGGDSTTTSGNGGDSTTTTSDNGGDSTTTTSDNGGDSTSDNGGDGTTGEEGSTTSVVGGDSTTGSSDDGDSSTSSPTDDDGTGAGSDDGNDTESHSTDSTSGRGGDEPPSGSSKVAATLATGVLIVSLGCVLAF